MRFVLDLTAVRTHGTIVYCKGLLPRLTTALNGDQVTVVLPAAVANELPKDLCAGLEVCHIGSRADSWRRVIWEMAGLPGLLKATRADVLFAPFGVAPLWSPCPILLAVRDPAPHLGSAYQHTWGDRATNRMRRILTQCVVRRAKVVMFPSAAAAEVLGASLAVPCHKRRVVYHGTDHTRWRAHDGCAAVLEKYDLRDLPYVLFVSDLYRQKHPETLIQGFAALLGQTRRPDVALAFAGTTRDQDFRRYLDLLVTRLNLQQRVRWLNAVANEDLPAVYQNALAFVLPSSLETFGQPYVEAMASGVPLICAETAVAREICGDAARYFAVRDAEGLARQLGAVLDGSTAERERMVASGRAQALRFSWDREARETIALLREVAGLGSASAVPRPKLRVLIDATSAREGGGLTYVQYALPALARQNTGHEYHVLLSKRYQADLIAGLPSGVHLVEAGMAAQPLVIRWLHLQFMVPRLLRRGCFDALLTICEVGTLRGSCRKITMVRNPNIFARIDTYRYWWDRIALLGYRLSRFPLAFLTCSRSDRVVFVSSSSREAIAPMLWLDPSRTRIVYHGISRDFIELGRGRPLPSDSLPFPYVLAVSTLATHKRYPILLRAFASLADEFKEHRLVIAGSVSMGALQRSIEQKARELHIRDRMVLLGFVEHERLQRIYANASLFVMPSKLETFCHPLVEAMACSGPIVATDLPVCREICRDAAWYFRPDDADQLAAMIRLLLAQPEHAARLVANARRRVAAFSWDQTARGMGEIVEEAVWQGWPR